jgi:endonuclease YncB( thermonuclease family)
MLTKYHMLLRCIFAGVILAFTYTTNAAELEGRVIGVSDGDTITVLDASNTQYKIRLSGIDAPEKRQAFGNTSKQSLSDLVYYKQVIVDWSKHDRYERIVGKVLVDGVDANLEQVKRGMAWFYKKYQKEQPLQDRLDYLHEQEAAELAHLGLWADNAPIPPWEFRKQAKKNQ